MTILDKFRSLLVIDILEENELGRMAWIKPGGIVVRRRVTRSPEQVKRLVAAHRTRSQFPLIVAANFEWGIGNDVKGAQSFFPGNMALAAAAKGKDKTLVTAQARAIAREMRSLGVNMLFGPVIDVPTDMNLTDTGVRMFSKDPKKIAWLAQAYIGGLQAGGLCATAKHFPGYAKTSVDSHIDLPICKETLAQLRRTGFVPFRAALRARAGAVMLHHHAFPRVTGNKNPTSMSAEMVALLRDGLGFQGVTITDNVGMGAIAKHFTPEEALLNPLRAGVDLVLSGNRNITRPILEKCDKTILKDPALREKIEAAFERVWRFRKKWCHTAIPPAHPRAEAYSRRVAEEIAVRSLTLLRDPKKLLPVTPERFNRVLIIEPQAKDGFHVVLKSNFGYFSMELKKTLFEADVVMMEEDPQAGRIKEILARAAQADLIIYALHEEPGIHGIAEAKMKMARELLTRFGGKTIIAGMVSPLALCGLPARGAAVFSYSAMPVSQIALAAGITGRRKITGVNPV